MKINEYVKQALKDYKVSEEDLTLSVDALIAYFEATTAEEEREHIIRVIYFLNNVKPLARLNDKSPKWEETKND